MRFLTLLLLVPLLLLLAADTDLAGRFAGDWKSVSGNGGQFRMSLEPKPEGSWKCEVTFTLAGEEVKTTMREVKVEQAKLTAAYDFEVQGSTLRSRITGQWNGRALEGQYQTTVVDGGAAVDSGTWNAARAK
jgi:hypothetical protein